VNQIPLRVSDYMSRDVITISADTEISRAVNLMIHKDISGLVVDDGVGGIAGVITERDCIAVAVGSGYYGELGGPVSTYMSTKVETVAPDENLIDVAARMAASPIRRFPVVEDGRLVGILSRRDVLRAIEVGSSWSAKT
jgi:CBS domain-containing protein